MSCSLDYMRYLCNLHSINFRATIFNLELMIKLAIHNGVFSVVQQSYISTFHFLSILPDDIHSTNTHSTCIHEALAMLQTVS